MKGVIKNRVLPGLIISLLALLSGLLLLFSFDLKKATSRAEGGASIECELKSNSIMSLAWSSLSIDDVNNFKSSDAYDENGLFHESVSVNPPVNASEIQKIILQGLFNNKTGYVNSEGVSFNIGMPYDYKIIVRDYTQNTSFDITTTEGKKAGVIWVRSSTRPGEKTLSASFLLQASIKNNYVNEKTGIRYDGFSILPIDYKNESHNDSSINFQATLSTSQLGNSYYANDVDATVTTEYAFEDPDNYKYIDMPTAYLLPRMFDVNFDIAGEGYFEDGSTSKTAKTLYLERINTPSEIPISSRKGYVFDGWDIESVYPDGFLYNGWHTIKAKWRGVEYEKFTFEDRRGSETYSSSIVSKFIMGEEYAWPTFEFFQGSLPDNEKVPNPGYKFLGWEINFIDGDGSEYNHFFEPGIHEIPYLGEAGEVVFTAKWEANKYKVTFDSNGATSGSMSDQQFIYGETAKELLENSFTKTGFNFSGWKWIAIKRQINNIWERTEIDEPVEFANKQAVQNLTTEDNVILVLQAQWEANKYTIVFHSNFDGASQDEFVSRPYEYQEIFTMPCYYELTEGETRPGYICLIWNTNASGQNGKSYNVGKEYSELSSVAGGQIHLYAQWNVTWAGKEGADIEPEYEYKNGVKTYYISSRENLGWLSLQFHKRGYKTDPTFDGFKGVNFVQTQYISLWAGSYNDNGDPWQFLKDLAKSLWIPIGNQFNPFRGNFYGRGYGIDRLVAFTDLEKSGGFFGSLKDANIKNVVIKSSFSTNLVDGIEVFGIISGETKNSVIENCMASGANSMFGEIVDCNVKNCVAKEISIDVQVRASNGDFIETSYSDNVGAFANKITNSNIYGCSVLSSSVEARKNLGTFAGRVFGGRIENCYTDGVYLEGETNLGFIGYAESTQIISCMNKAGYFGDTSNGSSSKELSSIYGDYNVGGMVGFVGDNDSGIRLKIENCYVDYSESGIIGQTIGGMIGYVSSTGAEIISSGCYAGFMGAVGNDTDKYVMGYMIGKADEISTISINYCFGNSKPLRIGNGYLAYEIDMIGMYVEPEVVKNVIKNSLVWHIIPTGSYYNTETYIYYDFHNDTEEKTFDGWVMSFGSVVEALPKGFSWLANAEVFPITSEIIDIVQFLDATENDVH